MKVLAIDASTKSTGVAILEDNNLIHYELFTNNSKNTLDRIQFMTDEIEQFYLEYLPDSIVIEEIIPDNLNEVKWSCNQNTFKALSYLQASILLMFNKYQKTVKLIGATSWRKICGIQQGKATREVLKARDKEFVKEKYNINVNDDIADAICIGYAELHNNTPKPFNWA